METKKTYGNLLTECSNLRSAGGASAHRRIVNLNAVFEDPEYQRMCSDLTPPLDAADNLDQYVEDLCLSFLQMREIFTKFPDAKHWANGKLKTLYNETTKILWKEKQSEPKETRTSYKEKAEEAESKLADVEFEQTQLTNQAVKVEDELSQLRERLREVLLENSGLKIENATLKGENNELQKQLSREMAAA